ncbi:hypothetical protein SAMN02910447_03171 [Ruminococcus sp. YE71]|uniref:hypothetical protein n=1 Tax=unclassified Ruminococcus TaxID=2608920 RepID=UPI00088C8FA0|nr:MULTISPECIES: hypothetical protein [unclassified Ruminococcus]SDA30327.1 hypothetical protein SAMN02910446_03242 [Ruminococcus sp. YE78]SFW49434.1 hypothetical protein SAMN02910447_03171 [Ruminococcus sp. YE71]
MNKESIVICENCGRKFRCVETGNIWPGGLESEDAKCPYCGTIAFSSMTSGFIYVYKLDKESENDENK